MMRPRRHETASLRIFALLCAATAILSLACDGTNWYEVTRSAN